MKSKRVKGLDPAAPLIDNAARIVRVRLGELCELAPAALIPGNETAQHDMRIAAKRLRYVLEATGFCFGEPAERARKRARDLQDVLGELHDCEVLAPRVNDHVKRLLDEDAAAVRRRAGDADDLDPRLITEAPNRTGYRGLEMLAVHVAARRALLFDRFVELWDELERDGVWERLRSTLAQKPAG